MRNRSYRDLIAWQRAMDLADAVYDVTDDWPRDEVYGLRSQARRAAVSVPSNVAEGQGRGTPGDFLRFLGIAHGSLCELETQLMLAGRRRFLAQQALDQILESTAEVGRLIHGLMRSLRGDPTGSELRPPLPY